MASNTKISKNKRRIKALRTAKKRYAKMRRRARRDEKQGYISFL